MKKDKIDEALTFEESREEISEEIYKVSHREDDPNVKYEKRISLGTLFVQEIWFWKPLKILKKLTTVKV